MKISIVQMDMKCNAPQENFTHAEALIRRAAEDSPDVILLPETWNTGFFPHEGLAAFCDRDGGETQRRIGALAKELCVNIVAGSVSDLRGGHIYNTAYVFDRTGARIAQYDKTHLFSYAREHMFYTAGDTLCGGSSRILDPWGSVLAAADDTEQVFSAELDLSALDEIRATINVYRDRRPQLYQIG